LSELPEKLGIGSENFIRDVFELFTDFPGRLQFVDISNDFPLLLARELPDLLNDFVCTHNANLPMFAVAGKPCGETTTSVDLPFAISDLRSFRAS
jgi:hypothetical protein